MKSKNYESGSLYDARDDLKIAHRRWFKICFRWKVVFNNFF